MGKQSKAETSENLVKGKVNPMQVAFIVDRYLSDNNFTETRSVFRNEASTLIAKSPVQEAPRSLLSLGAMLNEYICLKEQKVVLDQEKVCLDQEKARVQTLLQGMQNVMKAYNIGASSPIPSISVGPVKSLDVIPQSHSISGSPAGCSVNNAQTVHPVPTTSSTITVPQNFASPFINGSITNKRMGSRTHPAAKKSCTKLLATKLPNRVAHPVKLQTGKALESQQNVHPPKGIEASPSSFVPTATLVQGSGVAKCLFNQPSYSIPSNSSGPTTPARDNSFQSTKSTSPHELSSTANCGENISPQEISPSCCTVISSSKRVRISPSKKGAQFSVETNSCISSSSPVKINMKRMAKRDHLKGRLDFDRPDELLTLDKTINEEASLSESEKESDIFNIELPNFDVFGGDFSFTEMLGDLDLCFGGLDCACDPILDGCTDIVSRSHNESTDGTMGPNQVTSTFLSTVTQLLSEKETNEQGIDSVTAVKSITKCITILSPQEV